MYRSLWSLCIGHCGYNQIYQECIMIWGSINKCCIGTLTLLFFVQILWSRWILFGYFMLNFLVCKMLYRTLSPTVILHNMLLCCWIRLDKKAFDINKYNWVVWELNHLLKLYGLWLFKDYWLGLEDVWQLALMHEDLSLMKTWISWIWSLSDILLYSFFKLLCMSYHVTSASHLTQSVGSLMSSGW